MEYSIYEKTTGRITGHVVCPPSIIHLQVGEGKGYIIGSFGEDEYVVANGLVTALPSKPSPYHSWDGSAWVLSATEAGKALKAKRYDVSVSGFIWNTWPVHSDMDSRSAAKDQCDEARAGRRIDGDLWKFQDGVFRELTNAQMIDMYETGQAFVRKCFAIEAIGQQLIAGGAYDIESIWQQAEVIYESG